MEIVVRSLLMTLSGLAMTVAHAGEPLFNDDVRPILSDKCFACHGPDSANRQAGLRLDRRDKATSPLESGETAIVPGKAFQSELLRRITSNDESLVMPPPESKLGRLTAEEVQTLKAWIEAGAAYQPHWAFLPVEPVAVPEGSGHPIDRLVQARLAERAWSLQPEADRRTLLRRLSFDLTGLPPTSTDLEAFLKDESPGAYESAVDRLLKSSRYGERMAADWLDVARYADSYGFQVDREREVWPWRDWVIRAFNENIPWDQFVTWQLAGDLLPEPTDDQILATAFNRLHQQEAEGGSVEEEYRVNYVNDRVVTFGTAFLGLTLECCRCHDHKFDPISQREYYQFFAFFDDIDEAGLYSFFTSSTPTPAFRLADEAQKQSLEKARQQVAGAEQELSALKVAPDAAFQEWLSQPLPSVIPGEVAHFSFESRREDGKFPSSVGSEVVATCPDQNVAVEGRIGQGLKLTGDHAVATNVGNFHAYEPFTVALWIQSPVARDRAVIMRRSQAWTDAASRGYELLMIDGRLRWSLIHFWPGDAISIETVDPLPLNEWTHVAVTSDGSMSAHGLSIAINGRAAPVKVVRDHLTRDIAGGGSDHIALGERFRDRGFKDGLVDELRVFGRALSPLEIAELHQPGLIEKARANPVDEMGKDLRDCFVTAWTPQVQAAITKLQEARKQVVTVTESIRDIMVMRDLPEPKPAYVLTRGEYQLRGDAVTAGTPEALPPFPADQPRNRLGLARWLTDARHPLLARVTVNRVWQMFFGRGLVKTAEDFGSQSERPIHRDVLDWLAADFVADGWDLKHLVRTIVTSQTYRQRSFSTPRQMSEDPENTWLARGPRFRLPAEMIRDQALLASGQLVERIGGPPVRTYDMPESFKPSPAGTGEQLYRRSLYTFWRRTGPAPVLETFDVPKRQICVARRDVTNTPLHALVLLNGPQFVEAARALAESALQQTPDQPSKALATAFERLTAQQPDSVQLTALQRMYDEQLAWFQSHSDDATAYLKVGSRPADANRSPAELAALTTVINGLMTLDAVLVKR